METKDYGVFRIDTRENEDVMNSFDKLQQEVKTRTGETFEIRREQLITGDVVVGNMCFERKEGNDFIASICDGRLKGQAAKMALNFEHKYYIIVGNMWEESGSINPRAVLGAQASLAVRYGSQFLQAQDKMGFAYLVYNIVKRYAEGQKFDPTTIALQNYTVDATQIFRNMLSCTGIGPVRSETLANNCGHDMERLYNLSQREISRLPKFGKVTAKKVHDAIRGVEIESD